MNMPHEPTTSDHYRAQTNHPPQRNPVIDSVDPSNQDMFARADVHPARATATDLAQRTSSQPPPQALSPASDIPDDLIPRIKAAATRSGLRYESFTQQLLNCAFAHVKFWQQSDVERLFWLADRLGLDPLERDLIALEQKEPFPPSLGFMITLDGWVKLLHRHPRFRGLNFEEGPSDEHGLPLWVACSVFWEGFACPWVVREWASEHRSLHESWLNYPRRMLRHKALTQCARLALGVGGGFWEVSGFDTPTYSTASEHISKSSSADDKARRYTSQAALKRTIALQDELSQPLKATGPKPAF